MSGKTDKALAKKEEVESGLALPADVQAFITAQGGGQENIANIKNPFFRISIAGSRFMAGNVPLGDDGKGTDFTAHILHVVPVRGFYKTPFDPAKPTPPDCASIGGVAPDAAIEHKESALCASCPQNRWGTGKDQKGDPSKGKACREAKRLVLWYPGISIPCLLQLPPTSHKYLEAFLLKCTNYPGTADGVPSWMVLTTFSFVPGNYPHPKVEDSPEGLVRDLALLQHLNELRTSDAYLKAARAFATEDIQAAQTESGSGAGAAVDGAADDGTPF